MTSTAKPAERLDRAPLLEHLEILYGDVRFGRERYLDLLERCARP